MRKILIGFGITSVVYFVIAKILEKKTYKEIETCWDCPIYVENNGEYAKYQYED